MICSKCGKECEAKPQKTDNSFLTECKAVSSCCDSDIIIDDIDYTKDQFQTMPRTGNNSNPEMMQGCKHYFRGRLTSAQPDNQTIGMPRRGDGKVYCNSCHTLDNFREVSLYSYRKNNFDELEVCNIHGKAEAIKEEIPALACNCCGNVQIKL